MASSTTTTTTTTAAVPLKIFILVSYATLKRKSFLSVFGCCSLGETVEDAIEFRERKKKKKNLA